MNIFDKRGADAKGNAKVEVLSHDRVGLVNEISSAIAASGGDIRGHHAKVFSNEKGEQLSRFIAEIAFDETQRHRLLHSLGRIKGIVSVTLY